MGKRGVTQKPGDGVLYKGCEIEHYRPEFTGDEYVQVFLHYVDADGPHKDYVYDSASELKNSTQYRFVFYPNMFENLSNYYTVQNALSKEELKQIQTVLATKILVDAQVGSQNSGSVEPSIRRSKVFWLPKTDEFAQLYTLFHKVIGQCNDTYYRFKLTEITEHIQYTVYSSEDEGFYDWHMDMGPGKSNRKLSLVCQLTDPTEYEGGELRIHTGHGHVTAEKEQGIIILFPSYLLHCVTPVTKGTRRSLVLWIEGPSFV
jgi:PKHD-type hydroxylase